MQRMDADVRAIHPRGLPVAPRDFGGLVSTLDGLGLDHVYADYWIAYRLAFDTRERIIASQIEIEPEPAKLTLRDGQAVPPPGSYVRYPPYAREVEAARHGFVVLPADDRQEPARAAAREAGLPTRALRTLRRLRTRDEHPCRSHTARRSEGQA